MANQQGGPERIARCACSGLTVTARGEPIDVYLCSCTACQRGTGSAFSYAAIFPESAISIAGERRPYRQQGDSGRFVDSRLAGRLCCFAPKGCRGRSACRLAASPIRALRSPRSCSGRHDAIIGSTFPKTSPRSTRSRARTSPRLLPRPVHRLRRDRPGVPCRSRG